MVEDKFWGKSLLIDLHDCNEKILDPVRIKEFVDKLCEEIKMRKFGPLHIERFGSRDLEGYSFMQFIETSSLTAHFDEKKMRAFIDIFSCKNFDEKDTFRFCKDFFGGDGSFRLIIRE